MVHGTWARAAPWTAEDAVLGTAIAKCCGDVGVGAFLWSGKNSHQARIEAGRELAAFVCEIEKLGCSRVILVGHSHGGNVILYALRNERTAMLVHRVVFLGTPFLSVRDRDPASVVGPPAVLLSWFVGLLMVITVILIPLYFVYLFRWRSRVELRLRKRFATVVATAQEKFRVWVETPQPGCPAFISHVAADEAGLVLRRMDQITSFPWAMHEAVRAATITTFLTFYATLILFVSLGYPEPPDEVVIPIVLLLPLMLILVLSVPVLAAAWSRALRGSPFGYGAEPLFEGAAVRISPVPVPQWRFRPGSQIVPYEHAASTPGLRHSGFYADQKLAERIALWIAERRQQEGAPVIRTPICSDNGGAYDRWKVGGGLLGFVVTAMLMAYGFLAA